MPCARPTSSARGWPPRPAARRSRCCARAAATCPRVRPVTSWGRLGARRPAATRSALTRDWVDRLIAVRGGTPRVLTFFGGALTIDVQVTARPGGIDVVGELAPVVAARMVAESPEGTHETSVDDEGRFRFE